MIEGWFRWRTGGLLTGDDAIGEGLAEEYAYADIAKPHGDDFPSDRHQLACDPSGWHLSAPVKLTP